MTNADWFLGPLKKFNTIQEFVDWIDKGEMGHPEPFTNEEILQLIGAFKVLQTVLMFRVSNS